MKFYLFHFSILAMSLIRPVAKDELILEWPCSWKNFNIPYTFDNFVPHKFNFLRNKVRDGLDFLMERTCLNFVEYDPIKIARSDPPSGSYLFYSYTDSLERCCFRYNDDINGKRIVAITPICSFPEEISHITLHAVGLDHRGNDKFDKNLVEGFFVPKNTPLCNFTNKKALAG